MAEITLPEAAAAPGGGPAAGPDRRARKKQLTRDALIQAALDLFEAKGYDQTAIHEITDAVDVSERTFFRYFASKEDLVLSFVRDGAAAFAAALAARPADEEPLAAARSAFLTSLRQLSGPRAEAVPTYLSVLRLIDATPVLLAAHLRYTHEHDHEVIGVLAQREGVDPETDRRPRVLAGIIGAVVFLALRDWRAGDDQSPEAMAAAFDSYADALVPALTGRWGAAG